MGPLTSGKPVAGADRRPKREEQPMITLNRRGSVSRKPTKDEARQLLSFPFGLTRTVRVPENFRRPRVGESHGHRVWTFDLAIKPRLLA
jgi:hypothetical protein